MDDKKVAFIICTNDELYLKECIVYIKSMHIPEGMCIDIIPVKGAKSMCSGYNTGMSSTDAKYKVYLHHDVFIINRSFIRDFMRVFDSDPKIGMIGVAGSSNLPLDAICFTGWDTGYVLEYGAYRVFMYAPNQDQDINYVWAVDGCLIVTNRDLPWREDIFDSWDFYDISQGMEFMEAGLRAAVPYQEHPWCFHDCGILSLDQYDRNRKIFCENYSKYFKYSEPDEYRENKEKELKASKEIAKLLPSIRALFDENKYAEVIRLLKKWEPLKNQNMELFSFYAIAAIINEEMKAGKNCLAKGGRNSNELLREYQLLRFMLFRLASDIEIDTDLKKRVDAGEVSVEALSLLTDLIIYDKTKVYRKLFSLGVAVPKPEKTFFKCPICGHRDSLIHYKGEERQRQVDYSFKYASDPKDNYSEYHSVCPECGTDRTERFIKLFLDELSSEETEIIGLNIIPENDDHRDVSWLDIDTEIKWYTEKSSLARIRKAGSVDVILGIDLLQNEINDRQIISDIYRLMKEDGIAIFIIPVTHGLTDTIEAGEVGDAARMKRTGAYSARRLYAEGDFVKRIMESGLQVQKIVPEYFGEFAENADIVSGQSMYVATKIDIGLQGIPMTVYQMR